MVRALAHKFPEAKIHYATKAAYKELIAHNPYIHEYHYLESDWGGFTGSFKGLQFDLFVDLHKNLRTQRLKAAVDYSNYVAFDKKNFDKWLLVNFKVNRIKGDTLLARYFDALNALGVHYDGNGLDYFLGDEKEFEQLGEQLPDSYEVVVLGGKHQTKKAPIDRLKEVLASTKGEVVLLGGPTEVEEALLLEKESRAINLTGKLTLSESAYVVSRCRKVIANDTGLMHIAAAFDRSLAVLWGSTVPDFGFSPVKPAHSKSETLHFQLDDLSCRPCSKLGYSKCPKGHFKCMQELDYGKLAEWLNQ